MFVDREINTLPWLFQIKMTIILVSGSCATVTVVGRKIDIFLWLFIINSNNMGTHYFIDNILCADDQVPPEEKDDLFCAYTYIKKLFWS